MNFSQKISIANDEVIQRFLVEIDEDVLALLITNHLDESATQRISKNMSQRAARKLIEDRSRFLTAVERYEKTLDSLVSSHSGNRVERAIVFTDLVSSTEKTSSLGDENYYENVLIPHNRILETKISKNRGTVIKTIGDSYLAVFESCLDAVFACIEIQQELSSINLDALKDYQFHVRTAVHFGEFSYKVLGKDIVDVHGGSVNYAARLLGVTGGGEIFVSRDLISGIDKEVAYLEKLLTLEEGRQDSEGVRLVGELIEVSKSRRENLQYRSAGMFSYKGIVGEQEALILNWKFANLKET